ncbi:hypothetical protein E2542_SST05662 [Spatholobus suberectus]|nr:hypothetical protein E2542_SST05662 [Spatholobus suberectus]
MNNKQYVVFRAMNLHGFLDQLQEKKKLKLFWRYEQAYTTAQVLLLHLADITEKGVTFQIATFRWQFSAYSSLVWCCSAKGYTYTASIKIVS